jgi:hypothetical protein
VWHAAKTRSSDALPFRRLWYAEPDAVANAIGYAKFFSRSHDAVVRICDEAGNLIETHQHAGEFKRGEFLLPSSRTSAKANPHDSAFIG